jgi:hypothetical protein
MLKNFRQFQFALARHLRDPLSSPAPEGVDPTAANACNQEMVQHLCEVLEPVFPMTHALLGDELWQYAVRLFLKEAPHHTPWVSRVQRAFIEYVGQSPEMQSLPAWMQDLAHFEWLQSAITTTLVTWPQFDATGDVMQCAVVLNPTHVEAAYEWPVHDINTDNEPNDMQNTHLTILRDMSEELHVFESSIFRAQLIDLLREGLTGEQAFMSLARWLSHPEPSVFVQEGQLVMAQLQREGVLLGTRV